MPGYQACVIAVALVVFGAASAAGQAGAPQPPVAAPAPAPEPPWTGSASLGLSLNRGNTDTTDFNFSVDAKHDPKTKNTWKLKALYLRGENAGTLTVNRLFSQMRYERSLTTRAFVFAQFEYVDDEFKGIDWLAAPNGGVGYKVVDTATVAFAVDGGFGVKWEKNPDIDTRTSAIVTAGDKLEYKVTPGATITQGFSALWTADDFGDALYAFSTALSSSLTKRTQLKVELLDAYKTRPPQPEIGSNDVSLVTAFVFKF